MTQSAAILTSEGRTALRSLSDELSGDLLLPGDPGWDDARSPWNLAVDQRPAAVAFPESARDVVAIVRAAGAMGLRVAAQGTGHNATPLVQRGLADTVLVRTSRMRGVVIDADRRIARAEAGAVWMDVVAPAATFGLAALAGSAADVGVVGYSLGGGLSWLARSHGLAANHVVAIEAVTADGERRRVDAQHDPELFWALRGGGGDFALVTAIEFRLFPVSTVYAGALFWPVDEADTVVREWRAWVETLPEDVTSVVRVMSMPPIPEIPEPLRGRSFTIVEAASQLSEADTDALLAPLRQFAPEIDTFRQTPLDELHLLHMDPPAPAPGIGDGLMLHDVDDAAIQAFLDAAGPGSGSALVSAELRHLGGAVARERGDGGAVSSFDGSFQVFGVGITPTPAAAAAVSASVGRLSTALEPWRADRSYVNFIERACDPALVWGDTLPRLRAVKATWDPAGRIRSNHPVG